VSFVNVDSAAGCRPTPLLTNDAGEPARNISEPDPCQGKTDPENHKIWERPKYYTLDMVVDGNCSGSEAYRNLTCAFALRSPGFEGAQERMLSFAHRS